MHEECSEMTLFHSNLKVNIYHAAETFKDQFKYKYFE